MPDDITPALLPPGRLAEIERREKAAKVGPWEAFSNDEEDAEGEPTGRQRWFVAFAPEAAPNGVMGRGDTSYILHGPTADFIAHARADVPALLAHIAALERLLHDLQLDSVALAAGERRERERCLGIVTKYAEEQEAVACDVSRDEDDRRIAARRAVVLWRVGILIGQPTTGPALPADLREENARLRRALGEIAEGLGGANFIGLTNRDVVEWAARIAREALKGDEK